MKHLFNYISLFLLTVMSACGGVAVPTENVSDATEPLKINPDYTDIVIPPNIAPMNFEIEMPGSDYVARVTAPDGSAIIAGGPVVEWNMKAWRQLLDKARGKELDYEIFVKGDDDTWQRYSYSCRVAEEDIDPYLSYRLIEPSYEQFSGMTINQRDLTSFDEEVVFNTPVPCDERRGFCINCHVPRNNYADRSSQFHIRKNKGGTVIASGDSVCKVNLKTDSTLSAGVYPAWHPTEDLIAYSTNDTHQKFFSFGNRRIEVYDMASDLILYYMKNREVSHIAADKDLMETFPAWSPDGRKLYYSVARYPEGVTPETVVDSCFIIRYDIVSRDFDPKTHSFSNPDTVVYASREGQSALLPRISPDGKYLLYCQAPFGTFHIWHPESDLFIRDLTTGVTHPLEKANSDDTDSYHSWSSNSRWIVFSSRRDDGSYTRPYIAYIDKEGRDSKAFIVPQKTPSYYRELMKSYNVPEFFSAPFAYSRSQLLKAVDYPAQQANYR